MLSLLKRIEAGWDYQRSAICLFKKFKADAAELNIWYRHRTENHKTHVMLFHSELISLFSTLSAGHVIICGHCEIMDYKSCVNWFHFQTSEYFKM